VKVDDGVGLNVYDCIFINGVVGGDPGIVL
jgi:hypothetical protein